MQPLFLRVPVRPGCGVQRNVHPSVGSSLSTRLNLEEDWLRGSLSPFILCVATGGKGDYMRQKEHCSTICRESFHHDEMKKNDGGLLNISNINIRRNEVTI